jgi:hypothetical protein
MYSRDPVFHAQHIPDAANSPFLPPGVPGQHSVFDREYTRGYFQNSPYSPLDKQYAAAFIMLSLLLLLEMYTLHHTK